MANEGDTINLTLTFRIPKSVQRDLQSWIFDYFTNIKVESIAKKSEADYEVKATLQERIMATPQLLEDNVKLAEMSKLLEKELVTASQTVEMYHQLNEKSSEEIDQLQKQLMQQSFIVEKLAKENTGYIEDLESKGQNSIGSLLHAMNSEKEDLISQGTMLTRKMQLMDAHVVAGALSHTDEIDQPFV